MASMTIRNRRRGAGFAAAALALVTGLWLVTFASGAASNGTQVSVASAAVSVNQTTTSVVRLSALAAGDSVNAYDITLTFGPGVTATNAAPASGWNTLVNTTGTSVHVAASQIGTGCTAACNLFTVTWQAGASNAAVNVAVSGTLGGSNAATGGGVNVTFVGIGGTITVTGGAANTPTNTSVPGNTPTNTTVPPTATSTTAGVPTATRTTAPTQASGSPTATTTTASGGTPSATNTPVPSGTASAGATATATRTAAPAVTATTGAIVISPGPGGNSGGGTTNPPGQAQPTTSVVRATTPTPPSAGTGQAPLPFNTIGYGVIALALAMTAALAFGPAFTRTPVGRRVASHTPFNQPDRLDARTTTEINRILDAAADRGKKAAEAETPDSNP
jgi:hypothetical protein